MSRIRAEQVQRAGLSMRNFMSLGDVTSLRTPFGECGSSPPSPQDYGYMCGPFSSHVRAPIVLRCGKGYWNKDSNFSRLSLALRRQRGKREAWTFLDGTYVRRASDEIPLFFVSVCLVVRRLCNFPV